LNAVSSCGPFASSAGSNCDCQASQYDCNSSSYASAEPCTGDVGVVSGGGSSSGGSSSGGSSSGGSSSGGSSGGSSSGSSGTTTGGVGGAFGPTPDQPTAPEPSYFPLSLESVDCLPSSTPAVIQNRRIVQKSIASSIFVISFNLLFISLILAFFF